MCKQEKDVRLFLFLFIAERIKEGGMIEWDIHCFLYPNLCIQID